MANFNRKQENQPDSSNYGNSTQEEDMHPERNPDIGQKGISRGLVKKQDQKVVEETIPTSNQKAPK